jgi:cysteine desulfurase family protein (TIGR01976 family)
MTQSRVNQPYPIEQIRAQFPALKRTYKNKPVAYLDGPGGSQVVQSAITAMVDYMSKGGANLHGKFSSSMETETHIAEARQAVADLVNAIADEVSFGANMTTLTLAISRALGRIWQAGDEIVVTEMDHRANVDPWISVAEDVGMTVRWIKVNPETLTLDLSELDSIITEKTRLVAVGLSSNAIGTINDVREIANRAKKVGSLVAVDAVHSVPHIPVDREQLQADILLFSAYKFFGPHVGMAVIRSELFESLRFYKLEPAPGYIPDKLETGTQNHEGIPAVKAAIDFIASLGQGDTRKAKLQSGYQRIEEYEEHLADKIRRELSEIPGVKLYQGDVKVKKTPTIAFQLEGLDPMQVCQWMAEEHSIFIASGHFYASTLARVLDVNKDGGWIRAGLAPYNTEEEAERLIEAVRQVTKSR